jgi:hypothetical protein
VPRAPLLPLFPFADALVAYATAPLRRSSLTDGFVVVVNLSEVLAVHVTALKARGPFVTAALVDPVEPVPFGARIDVGVWDAVDVYGRRAEVVTPAFDTIADPGTFTSNGGFEGDGGWIGQDTATTPYPPMEGRRYASVRHPDTGGRDLVGYAEVPADATKLRFWGGVVDWIGPCALGTRVRVETVARNEIVFEGAWLDAQPCTPGGHVYCVPWTEIIVDVSGLGGQRLVVRATAAGDRLCAPGMYETLLLDGFRFE